MMIVVKLVLLQLAGLAYLFALNVNATRYHGLTCDLKTDPAFGLTQSKEVSVVL
jgi:hypothetical protein